MVKGKVIQVSAIDATMDKLLRELIVGTFKEGYEVIGICSKGNVTDKLIKEGFNIINIKIDRSIRPISNLKSIIEMYRLFKKEKPDIVHVHTPIAAVLGRIAAKLARVPNIIYTAHGFYFHENMRPLIYKIILNIEKYMGRFFTDYIFTQSEEDRQTALINKFIKEDRIITISNGVDVFGEFNPGNINAIEILELRAEFKLKDSDKIVTFVGRLVREKGILDLLEAFNEIKRRDVKLIVVGDVFQGDRDKGILTLIDSFKNNPNIIFTGVRNDIKNILYLTDVFCLPSYREGMPRSIIEAMAMECAVVATDIRGCREEVLQGETGFLIPVSSPKEIRNKLLKLLEEESLLDSMKIKGRIRAEELFDEKKVVKKQINMFNSLIALDIR